MVQINLFELFGKYDYLVFSLPMFYWVKLLVGGFDWLYFLFAFLFLIFAIIQLTFRENIVIKIRTMGLTEVQFGQIIKKKSILGVVFLMQQVWGLATLVAMFIGPKDNFVWTLIFFYIGGLLSFSRFYFIPYYKNKIKRIIRSQK